MLKNSKGSTLVPVPNDPLTAKKCEYIFIIAAAAFPSGVSVDAVMFEDEQAFLCDLRCHTVYLGNFDIGVRHTDLYDAMHEKALEFFPGFEVCATPKKPEEPTEQEGMSDGTDNTFSA